MASSGFDEVAGKRPVDDVLSEGYVGVFFPCEPRIQSSWLASYPWGVRSIARKDKPYPRITILLVGGGLIRPASFFDTPFRRSSCRNTHALIILLWNQSNDSYLYFLFLSIIKLVIRQDNHREVRSASEESMLKRVRISELQSVAMGDRDSVMGEANEDPMETNPLNILRGRSPEEAPSPVSERRPLSPTTEDGMSALRIEDVLIPTIVALPSSAGASVGQEIIAASVSKEVGVDGTTTKRSRKPQSNSSGLDQAKVCPCCELMVIPFRFERCRHR